MIGFQQVVETLKSFVLALALVDKRVTVENAVSLSRLEQDYQVRKYFIYFQIGPYYVKRNPVYTIINVLLIIRGLIFIFFNLFVFY